MGERLQAIRGMNDVLPEACYLWRHIEQTLIRCVSAYGYQEIRFPLVESTQLFKRTVGEVTDIVEKEMYTFTDLNGESLSLRPEGTAGCVRACIENGLLYNQQQKLWYLGPMFRHERPQKGRYRQFNHFGVEAFGFSGPAIELEMLLMCHTLWQELGFGHALTLQINTIGTLDERQAYKKLLVEYFTSHAQALDEDSKKRLHKNPLRILDSKNPAMQPLIANAPQLLQNLGEESHAHFKALCHGLDALQIAYTINPLLVRGLDYYGHTVFEWVTDKLGSQATVCAGGRYDTLVEQLDGAPTAAVGFAFGIERILLLHETLQLACPQKTLPALFLIPANAIAELKAIALAQEIRANFPSLPVLVNLAGGSFKSQFKKADKSGARWALILGDEEIATHRIGVKDLRQEAAQITIEQSKLHAFLEGLHGE